MRQIIVDMYELTEEEQKTKGLWYKKRAKAYVYSTGKVIDFAVTEHYKKDLKIGDIIGG